MYVFLDAGELFSFGGATEGQLGHKELVNISEPKKISAFEEKFVVSINSGPFHSVATCVGSSTSSSESLGRLDVYIWGKVGKFKDYAPHMIESLKRKCLLNVSCNIKTTVAIISKCQISLFGEIFNGTKFFLKRFKRNSTLPSKSSI